MPHGHDCCTNPRVCATTGWPRHPQYAVPCYSMLATQRLPGHPQLTVGSACPFSRAGCVGRTCDSSGSLIGGTEFEEATVAQQRCRFSLQCGCHRARRVSRKRVMAKDSGTTASTNLSGYVLSAVGVFNLAIRVCVCDIAVSRASGSAFGATNVGSS